jgi:predicted amidohydrolase
VRVGFMQYRVKFGDPEYNRKRARALVKGESFDLLVLPELCFSGYFMPSREEAFRLSSEFDNGPDFDFIHELAERHHAVIVFGFPERAGDKVYNSAAAILPGGSGYRYRKVHLFNLEKFWFDPGDLGFSVFEFNGARIGMMICFDWLFPEAARSLTLKGADIICHPSNLVLHYCQDAMVTRALENGVFIITCNRIGKDKVDEDEISFTGRSQITAPHGEVLRKALADREEVQFVDVDFINARDKSFTPNNDRIADRRPESYW